MSDFLSELEGVAKGAALVGDGLNSTEATLSLAANSGGSGRGMSYYAQAARCGRRAKLANEKYQRYIDDRVPLPEVRNAFVIGSVYHKLHEMGAQRGEHRCHDPHAAIPTIDLNETIANLNVAEGIRLFKGWVRHWGLGFWGLPVAIECQLPGDDDTLAQKIVDIFGEPVTGALDLVVDIGVGDIDRIQKRVPDITPGRYIIDYKTSDGPNDPITYSAGLQSLWYPELWNMAHPDKPVDGMIFDCVYKRARRKDRSVLRDDFGTVRIASQFNCVDTLKGMIEQGALNVAADRPNRAECCDWRGSVCPFFNNGCDQLQAQGA